MTVTLRTLLPTDLLRRAVRLARLAGDRLRSGSTHLPGNAPPHAAITQGIARPAANRADMSVVLGTFNRCNLLKIAIESIRQQDYPGRVEIIVVDGGSDDGSLEWLLAQKDIITIVQHNHGAFRGKDLPRRSWGYFMNLGFKVAQGRWITMVSDDCVLLPNALRNAAALADQLAAGGRRIGGVAFYFRNWPSEATYYVQSTLGNRLMVNHGLFNRDLMETIGFADEVNYAFYKADGDLNLRIWESGYEIVPCETAILEHYMNPDEKIRAENNETLDTDRDTYIRRWARLGKKTSRHELDFVDPDDTARRLLGPVANAESVPF